MPLKKACVQTCSTAGLRGATSGPTKAQPQAAAPTPSAPSTGCSAGSATAVAISEAMAKAAKGSALAQSIAEAEASGCSGDAIATVGGRVLPPPGVLALWTCVLPRPAVICWLNLFPTGIPPLPLSSTLQAISQAVAEGEGCCWQTLPLISMHTSGASPP